MLESFAVSLVDTPLNLWIKATIWVWPMLEIIHFMGLSLLLGGLIVFDLRLAGHFKALNPDALQKLLPLVLLGFGLNLVTGILFFYGDPLRYSANIGFQIKMILIVLAGLNAVLYYLMIEPVMNTWDARANSPLNTKCVAYASLVIWTGVLLCGRLIPYVGTG
ncbi:MAG: hypothetical protein CMQ17_05695 [Gammaproteobacteria bacterium]|jgi:hypothetical protein|nr:hypothetical protein [Gammaproteobacteria bacterium]|tara:strand:- start:2 stop:490 length:489 start_codon:yes stop_codon:yes gene_type:complete